MPAIDGAWRSIPAKFRFLDRDNPQLEGGSILSYRYNDLLDSGAISVDYFENPTLGGRPTGTDGVRITREGLNLVAEIKKTWLSKAIDKQPMTFLQVVLFLVSGAIPLASWLLTRFLWSK